MTETDRRLGPAPGAAEYRKAWLSLVVFLPATVAAFVVGEGLAELLGPDVAPDELPPFWVVAVSGVPAMLVFCIPAVMAWGYSRRAARLGHPSATAPAIVATVIAAAFVAQNVLSYLLGVLVD